MAAEQSAEAFQLFSLLYFVQIFFVLFIDAKVNIRICCVRL